MLDNQRMWKFIELKEEYSHSKIIFNLTVEHLITQNHQFILQLFAGVNFLLHKITLLLF
jgi:hypothetical protein